MGVVYMHQRYKGEVGQKLSKYIYHLQPFLSHKTSLEHFSAHNDKHFRFSLHFERLIDIRKDLGIFATQYTHIPAIKLVKGKNITALPNIVLTSDFFNLLVLPSQTCLLGSK